jgi:mannitol operon transcriptional antiterminator
MSNVLSSREKKIIGLVLKASSSITLQEISDEIGVSRRTVLRTMPYVYDWFSKKGFDVERNASKGIHLEVSEIEKQELYAELNDEVIVHYYSKKERILYIITELLQTKNPLKLSYFAVVLQVSEASISKDLNSVEEWLSKYDLVLERKQGYGILVDGREKDKRRALVNIMYEMLDSNQLRDAVQRQIGMDESLKVTSKIRKNLLDMIDVETITVIENAIKRSEKEIGFRFTESSFTALAVHLTLAYKRIQDHEVIAMRPEILEELKLQDEYIVAERLISYLKEILEVHIPDDEIGYVTLHLKGARYKNGLFDSNLLQYNEQIIGNYQLTLMINRMIAIASEESGYDLKKVDSLLIGLVDHLRPAISRIQVNLDIRNPLLEKIISEYPDLYKIAKTSCTVLDQTLGIKLPDSEIGYIAMHIGSAIEQIKNKSNIDIAEYNIVVTCISGIGTSKMLAERIKKEFDNLNIIEVFASTSVKDEWLLRNEIDLILSTVHFHNNTVPVLTVNPLLLEQDIKKIKQKLSTLNIVRNSNINIEKKDFKENLLRISKYSSAMLELIEGIKIVSNLKEKSYESFLNTIVSGISDDPVLLLEIQEREQIGQIVFEEEKVIFLHTRSTVIDSLKVHVVRNKYIIHDGDKKYDTALVLVAPKEVDKYKLEIMGEISSKVVSEENFLHDLRSKSEEGLYQLILGFLESYLYKKIR